jgi:mannose-6-phosphate isomerase-like protein (cupin superfamily)
MLLGSALAAATTGALAADMHGAPAPSGAEPAAPFVMPDVKEDPNPVIIQGPAGEIFRFVRTGASTCGRYLMAKAMVPSGAGPLPHIHHWTDEFFVFPEGKFTLYMGTQLFPSLTLEPGRNAPKDHVSLVPTKPGDVFYGPRFYIHGLINHDQKPRELVFIWMPDTPENSILNYFKAVGQVLESPDNPPPIDPIAKIRFVTEAPRYGINQSSDFFQYVATTDIDGRPAEPNRNQQLLDMLNTVGDGTRCAEATSTAALQPDRR